MSWSVILPGRKLNIRQFIENDVEMKSWNVSDSFLQILILQSETWL